MVKWKYIAIAAIPLLVLSGCGQDKAPPHTTPTPPKLQSSPIERVEYPPKPPPARKVTAPSPKPLTPANTSRRVLRLMTENPACGTAGTAWIIRSSKSEGTYVITNAHAGLAGVSYWSGKWTFKAVSFDIKNDLMLLHSKEYIGAALPIKINHDVSSTHRNARIYSLGHPEQNRKVIRHNYTGYGPAKHANHEGPQLTYGGKPAIQGESGSPVIQNNKVIGVVYASDDKWGALFTPVQYANRLLKRHLNGHSYIPPPHARTCAKQVSSFPY